MVCQEKENGRKDNHVNSRRNARSNAKNKEALRNS
jgi:hypothetical protein